MSEGKKIVGEGSTENKVMNLAEHVASLSLGRVILEHNSSKSHWNEIESNNLLFTCPDYKIGAGTDFGFIEKTKVSFQAGNEIVTNNLYFPPISKEQDEILKELRQLKDDYQTGSDRYLKLLEDLEVYAVRVESRFSHYSATNDSISLLQWPSSLFPVFKRIKLESGGVVNEINEFDNGDYGANSKFGLKKTTQSIYLDNDGKEIIASFTGVMLCVPSLMSEKEIIIPFRSSAAPYENDNNAVTSFEIIKKIKVGDLMV
ncbi:hypothetical protein QNF03_002273 [Vibrio cidicii]|nr:hypothetical protein [Vibrio cidicii]